MRRAVDHLNAQTLMAAPPAELRLRSETEKVPQQPTTDEIETHQPTHAPYRDSCELCQSCRPRQTPHPASDHDKVSHPQVSYDFGVSCDLGVLFQDGIGFGQVPVRYDARQGDSISLFLT